MRTHYVQHNDCRAKTQHCTFWKSIGERKGLPLSQNIDMRNAENLQVVMRGLGSTPGNCPSDIPCFLAPKHKTFDSSATIWTPPLQPKRAGMDDSPGPVALQTHVEVCVLGVGDLQQGRVGGVAQQMLGDVSPIQSSAHLCQ